MDKKHVREMSQQIDTQQLPRAILNAPELETSSLSNLLTIIESKLSLTQLKSVQEIGLAIGTVGLSLDDACLRSRVTKEELDNWILYCPELKTYLNLKQVEYKYKLLDVVTKHATTNGDVKIAMWLLEKHYGNEYDSSLKKDIAKMNRENSDDVVEMAFAFVRRTSNADMPVNKNAGNEEKREIVKIHDMSEVLS
jgi:hypothetical protein